MIFCPVVRGNLKLFQIVTADQRNLSGRMRVPKGLVSRLIFAVEEEDKVLNEIARGVAPRDHFGNKKEYENWCDDLNADFGYKKRFLKIMELMPFAFQKEHGILGETFNKKVSKLKQNGMDKKAIAEKLGISKKVVSKVWKLPNTRG